MPSEDIWITCLESGTACKADQSLPTQKNLSSTESEQLNKRTKLIDESIRDLQGNDIKTLDEDGLISLLDTMIRPPLSIYLQKKRSANSPI
jgi:hypothetical protein